MSCDAAHGEWLLLNGEVLYDYYHIMIYYITSLPCFSCRCRRDCAQTMPMPCHVILRGCTRARTYKFTVSAWYLSSFVLFRCFNLFSMHTFQQWQKVLFSQTKPKNGSISSRYPYSSSRFLHDQLGLPSGLFSSQFQREGCWSGGYPDQALRDMMDRSLPRIHCLRFLLTIGL